MPSSAVASKLHIRRRRSAFHDRLRSYRVIVDGNDVGRIRAGEAWEYDVSPGHHTIRLRIDWTGSPSLAIQFSPGEVVELEVEKIGVLRNRIARR